MICDISFLAPVKCAFCWNADTLTLVDKRCITNCHLTDFGSSAVMNITIAFYQLRSIRLLGDGEVDRDEFIALQKLWDVPEDKAGMGFDKLTNVRIYIIAYEDLSSVYNSCWLHAIAMHQLYSLVTHVFYHLLLV